MSSLQKNIGKYNKVVETLQKLFDDFEIFNNRYRQGYKRNYTKTLFYYFQRHKKYGFI